MSEDTIVEITDSSIKLSEIEQDDADENNKRKLSIDEDLEESKVKKKLCRDTENFDDSLIVEPTITESDINDKIEKNVAESKGNNEEKSNTEDDSHSLLEAIDKSDTINDASNCESSDDDNYDDSLIIRAMSAALHSKQQQQPAGHSNLPTPIDDDPIALDSDSDEGDNKSESFEEINDKIVEEEEEEVDEEDSLWALQKRYNPKFECARRLIKRSIRILSQRSNARVDESNKTDDSKNTLEEINKIGIQVVLNSNVPHDSPAKTNQICAEKLIEEKVQENEDTSAAVGENKDDCLNVSDNKKPDTQQEKNHTDAEKNEETERDMSKELESKREEFSKLEDSSSTEIRSLLNEISSCNIDEIMSRYIFCNTDHSSFTIDEFSEQLFYCLQENKKEIEQIQRLWNEKIHLKFKMREIMERIRRHRVMSEIETFGMKPSQDSQQNNMFSSKSSTTNSENEHYIRSSSSKLSSQSVNRLIQDVRENVLKKEKHKADESAVSAMHESYDECSSFGLSSGMFQTSSSQGRQGQTIDVQSIINDFRQKNPQEIPRRGRRMKSSFSNNFLTSNQLQAQQLGNKDEDKMNHSVKSNSSVGFPEVSLLPVNSFYKNHSPQYGQKSSLLQSILTKQPNKSSLAIQPNNNKSSTLARLLTAPEKSFQSPSRGILQQNSKVHSNGEITITPITGTSMRRQLMDDEENSEPALIIDESEDFDMNDRHNTSGSDLLCQGCRRNKALFMCAGCSRQWYCSKECQELAWDDHAESCMV